jgi:hypothetical protein
LAMQIPGQIGKRAVKYSHHGTRNREHVSFHSV